MGWCTIDRAPPTTGPSQPGFSDKIGVRNLGELNSFSIFDWPLVGLASYGVTKITCLFVVPWLGSTRLHAHARKLQPRPSHSKKTTIVNAQIHQRFNSTIASGDEIICAGRAFAKVIRFL